MRRIDRGLAFPFEEVVSEGSAVCEHPGVELELVQDVAEVVDQAVAVAAVLGEEVGVLEQLVSSLAEAVGPRERPRSGS